MDPNAHHAAHLDLLPTDSGGRAPMATHVAVRDGDWFDASTWAGGKIPGNGALVHIPQGVSVDYEGSSAAKLFIVRVDGELTFTAENGGATKMVVDTMITAPGSTFRVDANGATDGTVDVVFAEGTPAAHRAHFTDHSSGDGVIGRYDWDPAQLSLGLVAAGTVEVHGQDVESSLTMYRGPAAGASRVVLETPDGAEGWAVGQKIVFGGMGYNGLDADEHLVAEDEVRTITNVRDFGGHIVVDFDRPLEYSHRGPVDPATGEEVAGKVGNLSRNVTFSSAVADGNGDGMADHGVPLGDPGGAGEHYVTERGHVMFMHNDDVGFTNSSLFGLGRTDKSTDVDDYVLGGAGNHRLHEDAGEIGEYDPGIDLAIATAPDEMMNQRGRYALHIHQAGGGEDDDHAMHGGGGSDMSGGTGKPGPCPITGEAICHCADQDGDGIENCDDPDYFDGAWIEGNVVWGSPGWGIVQHDSAAVLKENVVFDVAGSAFVSEIGNETGRWEGNLAVGTYGAGERPEGDDASDFNEDSGYAGNGFYLKSRAIEVVDNTAHSSARAGFYYHNHGVEYADTPISALDGVAIGDGAASVATEDVPIRVFEDNAVFAAKQGIRIVTDPLDSVRKYNDAWSHLKDFTAVEVDESGVSITYSSKYIFENFKIFGTADKVTEDAQRASAGFFFKASAADLTVVGGHVENFGNAVTNWSMIGDRQEYRRGYWDPKNPTNDSPDTARHDGMGAIEGIENPAWNLWDTNVVGLSTADIDGVRWRMPGMEVETSPGVFKTMSGAQILSSASNAPNAPGVEIELLGDSRDGGLVALWREGLANNPDQAAVLAREMPLAYQETEYLSQLWFEDGSHARRRDFEEATKGLNADIWSGTALEFAKTDSLGRKVFLYGDFSPLDPGGGTRTQTTNEKILFTREMVDGVLVRDGFMRVSGINDVRFVVMKMAFTDRLTGEIENKQFLVALDRAWQLPAGARDAGVLRITDETIVAPEYRVFHNGALVAGRAPIVIDQEAALETGKSIAPEGASTIDTTSDGTPDAQDNHVRGGDGDDSISALGGNDSVSGGAGNDSLFGGAGDDLLEGDAGNDVLSGGDGRDVLRGGEGHDTLSGGTGDDMLAGGTGDDMLLGDAGNDMLHGEDGDDLIDGGEGDDGLFGGAGHDRMFGGEGHDRLLGAAGDDLLRGGSGRDELRGGGGDDTLDGGADSDLLFGDAGADRLLGQDGNDVLRGDAGADYLSGGNHADQLFGGTDADRLEGDGGDDTLFGGDGDDTLFGGTGGDMMRGDAGADELRGDSGHDTLLGDAGEDRLFGDSGNDVLRGGDNDDKLVGGTGHDFIDGGAGADRAFGDAGADLLVGGAGDDWLNGGTDDDNVQGEDGDDAMTGGGGDDILKGGAGNDRMSGNGGVDLLLGGEGDDVLAGGAGDDLLMGQDGNDRMFGEEGADRMEGVAGDDMMRGGAGDDVMFGGIGHDSLRGDAGSDDLRGGDGNDRMDGGADDDRMFGGAGDDVLLGGGGADHMLGNSGDDLLIGQEGDDRMEGGDGHDRMQGGEGDDRLDAGTGDDSLDGGDGWDWLNAGAGHDVLRGGAGNDRLLGGGGNDLLDAGADNDLLMGHGGDDRLFGGDGNDILRDGAGNDRLDGGAGNDILQGGDGADELEGGGDNDVLQGEDGDDRLFGGTGDDRLQGGGDNDLLVGGRGDDRLDGGQGDDTLFGGDGNDRLDAGGGGDSISGADGADFLNASAGSDTLDGGTGDDVLLGGGGNDRLDGGDGADIMVGNSGDDILEGGAGNDVMQGDDGDDRLVGGAGDDRLQGGAGSDRFVFDDISGNDIITDFEDGVDAIDFLIDSFGFDDLTITQSGADALVSYAGGGIRMIGTDADQLDTSDFGFHSTA